jgi:hypothetical protein
MQREWFRKMRMRIRELRKKEKKKKDENKREHGREQMNDNRQVLSTLLEKMPNMLYRL